MTNVMDYDLAFKHFVEDEVGVAHNWKHSDVGSSVGRPLNGKIVNWLIDDRMRFSTASAAFGLRP
jgi:hypothetical protein